MPLFKKSIPQPVSCWVHALKICDPERYQILIKRPLLEQDVLGAICYLSVELKQIPLGVSHTTLAQVKLQWWVDLLEGKGKIPQGHPLGKAILFLENTISLDRTLIIALIQALQEKIIFTHVPETTDDFMARSRPFGQAFMRLFLKGLSCIMPLSSRADVKKDVSLEDAICALGVLWEVGMHLRYWVDRWNRGCQDMPMVFLQNEGIDPLKPLDWMLKEHPLAFMRAFRQFTTDVLKQKEGKLIRGIQFPLDLVVLEKMRERLLFMFTVMRHAKRMPLTDDAFAPPWFFKLFGG